MILLHHGGVYVALDMECLRPIDALPTLIGPGGEFATLAARHVLEEEAARSVAE